MYVLDLKNLQEQVKKAHCFKHFANFQPSVSNIKGFSRTFFSRSRSEQFLKQNTIVSKIVLIYCEKNSDREKLL